MKARDRRALWVLGTWVLAMGAWSYGRAWLSMRQELDTKRASLAALSAKEQWIRASIKQVRTKRGAIQGAMKPAWLGLPEDQMRLRFQDALLSAAQRAGLQEVRLRTLPWAQGAPSWRLEGVGSLSQWMDFVEGMEAEGVPLDLKILHWGVQGDPWNPQGGEAPGGPLLRGETEWVGLVLPGKEGQ